MRASRDVSGRGDTDLLGGGIGLGVFFGRGAVRGGRDGCRSHSGALGIARIGGASPILGRPGPLGLGNDRLDADGRQGEGRLGIQGV